MDHINELTVTVPERGQGMKQDVGARLLAWLHFKDRENHVASQRTAQEYVRRVMEVQVNNHHWDRLKYARLEKVTYKPGEVCNM
jgi:hypothetical protein